MLKNPPRFGERQIFYLKLETAAVECVSQFDCFAAERSFQKEDLSREHTFLPPVWETAPIDPFENLRTVNKAGVRHLKK